MRRLLSLLIAAAVLCGFDSSGDGTIDRWWFNSSGGLTSGSGVDVDISSASPPAALIDTLDSGTEPFFVNQSANDTTPGPYGLYLTPDTTNLAQRASFETCDGSNRPVGWTITMIDGSGSSDAVCSTTHKAHGSNGLKVTVTATDGRVYMYSACMPIDKTKKHTESMYVYGDATDENYKIGVDMYGAANCTTYLAGLSMPSFIDLSVGWSKQTWAINETGGAVPAWHASTVAAKLYINFVYNPSGSTTIYADLPSLWEGDGKDLACACDTDLPCSCTRLAAEIRTLIGAGNWQFEATVRSPIDGAVTTPVRQIFFIPATSGDNNKISFYWSADTLTLKVWSQAGVENTATVSAPGDANVSYRVKAYHTNDGRIGVCWDGTCGTEATGAITIIPATTTYLGGTDTTSSDIWIYNAHWKRRLTDPIGS